MPVKAYCEARSQRSRESSDRRQRTRIEKETQTLDHRRTRIDFGPATLPPYRHPRNPNMSNSQKQVRESRLAAELMKTFFVFVYLALFLGASGMTNQ